MPDCLDLPSIMSTTDEHTSYQSRNDTYVSRMPSPPYFPLLKPLSSVNALEEFQPPAGVALPPFLRGINVQSLFPQTSLPPWEYSNRYSAQMILPYLYLGPSTVAKDSTFLQKAQISLIVMVRQGDLANLKPPKQLLNARDALGIELYLPTVKSIQDLSPSFFKITDTINAHLNMQNTVPPASTQPTELNGAVLVCCDSGTELSASVTIAYLMQTLGLDLLRSHRLVQDIRFCISISQPVARILEASQQVLAAQREIASQRPLNDSSFRIPLRESKRRREDDADEAMDHDVGDDIATRSRVFTPFQG